ESGLEGPSLPTPNHCVCSFLEFKVKNSSGHPTAALGGSVGLLCRVDKSLLQESLKVEWRRADLETLVHLYQDGQSRPKKQHKDYHHRAHFLKKKKIKDGNFSLRLEKLRAEDAGKYTCKVYSDQDFVHSADTEVILGKLERYILPKLFMFLSVFPEVSLRKLLNTLPLTFDVTEALSQVNVLN
uniref:Ig-like domain-containing protein n=1 Tax=Sinocyclocheilus grahami TaxID=75366 RepID=A0A672PVW8_SINGR